MYNVTYVLTSQHKHIHIHTSMFRAVCALLMRFSANRRKSRWRSRNWQREAFWSKRRCAAKASNLMSNLCSLDVLDCYFMFTGFGASHSNLTCVCPILLFVFLAFGYLSFPAPFLSIFYMYFSSPPPSPKGPMCRCLPRLLPTIRLCWKNY